MSSQKESTVTDLIYFKFLYFFFFFEAGSGWREKRKESFQRGSRISRIRKTRESLRLKKMQKHVDAAYALPAFNF